MPATIFDWVARVTMLVLAGLVTLSILGSIAALSTESGGPGGFTVDRPLIEPAQPAEENGATPQPQPQEGNGMAGTAAGDGGGTVAAVAPPEEKEERWLEAIAYALLALAGLGAIAVLMLWRIVRELRRTGDALLSRLPQP